MVIIKQYLHEKNCSIYSCTNASLKKLDSSFILWPYLSTITPVVLPRDPRWDIEELSGSLLDFLRFRKEENESWGRVPMFLCPTIPDAHPSKASKEPRSSTNPTTNAAMGAV